MSTTPHDALVKFAFSRLEHAEGELRIALPKEISRWIDFTTLALCPGSFVDDGFREHHTDLLYAAKLAGREAFVYLLFEHQSTIDLRMPFRVLRYMVRVWESFLRDHPNARRLPLIIPLVLHHGEGGWRAAESLEELYDAPPEVLAEIGEHLPRFRFVLDDLAPQTDEALKNRAMSALGRLVLWCLKNARDPDRLIDDLERWADTFHEVRRAPHGPDAVQAVLRYMYFVHDRLDVQALRELVAAKVGRDIEEEVVTLGERLIEQGMQKGLHTGLQKGRREMLIKLLGLRFGELPGAALARIEAADSAQLDLWAERVITAPTLAGVLGD